MIYSGQPSIDCVDAVYNYIDENFPIWAAMFFLFSVPLLIGIVASCMICCCYKRNGSKSVE
jgi:hypothetical protein